MDVIHTPPQDMFYSAFIAFIGRPNSGKSSLLNAIIGQNLSIVTPLPQTTWKNTKGIYTEDNLQLVCIDTPGIHHGKHLYNKSMYMQSTYLVQDKGVDILVYLVDISRSFGQEEDHIAQILNSCKKKVLIVFNKIDLAHSADSAILEFFTRYPTLSKNQSVQLSALSPDAKKIFIEAIRPLVTPGQKLYSDDEITDSSMRFFAAECIRKQIITNIREEVPHASAVEILQYKEEQGVHHIEVEIHTETQGQKAILIGKSGVMIKKIRKNAEKELALIAQSKVSMSCHIKVSPHWRDNRGFLASMGLDIPKK